MTNAGSGRTQTDKARSKQMSRPVSADQGGRRTGRPADDRSAQRRPGGPRRRDPRSGGVRPPGPNASRPTSGVSRRSPSALLTWGTAAIVLVIVVVLVVVKVTGTGTLSPGSGVSPASPAVVAEVSHVPGSVFNAVGVNAPVSPINPPITIPAQKPLTLTAADGKSLPGVFFYGAEYCPFCAAARWSIVVALSRFGTFHKLEATASSASDSYPNTPTFSFAKATYSSPYIVFKPDEYLSNQPNAAGTGYKVLMKPTKLERSLIDRYDTSTYFPGLPADQNGFPFLDFGNKLLQSTVYDPSILQGLSRNQIARGLSNPKNPITQVIVAGANYLSASVCDMDGQAPAGVCTSKGVTAAARALKLG
jgi:hypothetical protein